MIPSLGQRDGLVSKFVENLFFDNDDVSGTQLGTSSAFTLHLKESVVGVSAKAHLALPKWVAFLQRSKQTTLRHLRHMI